MGRILVYLICIALLSVPMDTTTAFSGDALPVKGGNLPIFRLPVPKISNEKSYLGVSGDGFFSISQIRSQGILIKVFNLYCPVCQITATAMSEIYDRIENNPDLKNKIKLIGIGAGNSVLEVETFKKTYSIPFPVFPDENFEIYQALGKVRIPFLMVVKVNDHGSQEIMYTHLGALTDTTGFLDLMVEAYGMKKANLLIRGAASSLEEPRSDDRFK